MTTMATPTADAARSKLRDARAEGWRGLQRVESALGIICATVTQHGDVLIGSVPLSDDALVRLARALEGGAS